MNLQYTSPFYMYLETRRDEQKKSQQAALPAAQLHRLLSTNALSTPSWPSIPGVLPERSAARVTTFPWMETPLSRRYHTPVAVPQQSMTLFATETYSYAACLQELISYEEEGETECCAEGH